MGEVYSVLAPVSSEEEKGLLLSLVAKIITNRPIVMSVVHATLKVAWTSVKEFLVEEIDPFTYLFHFLSEEDRSYIMAQSPWNVRGQLMVFKQWEFEMVLQEVSFRTVPFWVQVHGLPRNRMGEANAQYIGLKLGKLLVMDSNEYLDALRRSFLRIRVELDLNKPLVASFPIPRLGLPTAWTSCRAAASHVGKFLFDYKMRAESVSLRRVPIVHVAQVSRRASVDSVGGASQSTSLQLSGDGCCSPLESPPMVVQRHVAVSDAVLRVPLLADLSSGTYSSISNLVLANSLDSLMSKDLSCPKDLLSSLKGPPDLKLRICQPTETLSPLGALKVVPPDPSRCVMSFSSPALAAQKPTIPAKTKSSGRLESHLGLKSPGLSSFLVSGPDQCLSFLGLYLFFILAHHSKFALLKRQFPRKYVLVDPDVDDSTEESPLQRAGFFHFVDFPPDGHRGGIVFAWKPGVNVELISTSPNFVNMLVYSDPPNTPWLVSCVYDPTRWHLRDDFWSGLDTLACSFGGLWLCMGDFNCLLADWEKQGGLPVASSASNPLQNLINSHGLIDLGFCGSPFTWHSLEWVQTQPPSSDNCRVEKLLILALNEELRKEEDLWRMKSRDLWLTTRDLNTKYFHTSTIIRRRRNSVDFLKTEDGIWISSREEVSNYISNFFRQLYLSIQPDVPHDLEGLVSPVLTPSENVALCAIPSAEVIHSTLLSLGSYKAPGPDGMTAIFYKIFWHIVGCDVVTMVHRFFVSGFLSREINHCHVVLIPKRECPSQVSQFRSISLCNVVSKLISKILANRMRLVIDKLILPLQAAFVPGRTIHENSILAHESFHVLRKRRTGRKIMAIRADIAKAYDCMEWKIILVVMRYFSFDSRFIGWIEQCLSTASCSILLNGTPFGLIKSTRGFRQARAAPPITHLLFTDDLLLFTRATVSEANVMWFVNRVFILKLAWLVHSNSSKPWIVALRAKYLNSSYIWDSTPVSSPSWVWKGVAKALLAWRESPWGLLTNRIRDWNIEQWIASLLDPVPSLSLPTDQSELIILYAAILMDVIWFSRNQVMHGGRRDDFGTIIRRIHRLYVEHSMAWSALVPIQSIRWSPPCGNG
ncbi:hypothetical protein CJ030_MR8G005522 [Morella rubra]|uniref:Reverse transcriptase domain-containing protein n=1 Tax=Morella rubra TaxID=262757 RepID=A0A6A1UVI0_9ROSI|nr:hypothetical protein CJ030_MR8G005522 [Morella rubra]